MSPPPVRTLAPHVQAAVATVQARLPAPAARTPAPHVQQALTTVQAKTGRPSCPQPPPPSRPLPPARVQAAAPAPAVRPSPVSPCGTHPGLPRKMPAAPPVQSAPRPAVPPRPAAPSIQPSLRPAAARAAEPPQPPVPRPAAPAPVVQPARRGAKWNKRKREKPREIDLVAAYLTEGEEVSSEDVFRRPERLGPEPPTPQQRKQQRKQRLLGVPSVDTATEELVNRMIDSESISEEDLILSTRGRRGKFDVVSKRPLLFWRGDSRSPAQVLKTGFSSRLERELRGSGMSDPSSIIWRASQDDIVNESAVCVARDVRGSMFFPLETGASIYIYAVALGSYVDTRRAQMLAESVETGASKKERRKWRRRSRYRYDLSQNIAQGEEGGAVWQFGEVATYEIAAEHIVGAWKVDRELISGDSSSMSGLRFRIRSGNLIKQIFKDPALSTLKRQAEELVSPYKDWYPRQGKYLSYQGIVTERTPDENEGPRRSRSEVFSRAPKPKVNRPRKNRQRPQGRGRQSFR